MLKNAHPAQCTSTALTWNWSTTATTLARRSASASQISTFPRAPSSPTPTYSFRSTRSASARPRSRSEARTLATRPPSPRPASISHPVQPRTPLYPGRRWTGPWWERPVSTSRRPTCRPSCRRSSTAATGLRSTTWPSSSPEAARIPQRPMTEMPQPHRCCMSNTCSLPGPT